MRNIPANDMHPVVMIECPRLLFPFARQIIADAVRGGGFPPLYIDPIDFAALYRQRLTKSPPPRQLLPPPTPESAPARARIERLIASNWSGYTFAPAPLLFAPKRSSPSHALSTMLRRPRRRG